MIHRHATSTTHPARTWAIRFASVALVMSLAACGSSVKLDEAPVEDRNAAAATGQQGQTGMDQGSLQGVNVPGIDTPQPAGLERLVYFDFDSFEVRADSTAVLEATERDVLATEGIARAMEQLDDRSRRIVAERWLKVNDDGSGGMTLHELAAQYGVSAERIRQIEVAAMKKMRKALEAYA